MYNMESKIIIFEGNQEQGIFSKARKFYDENISDDEIKNKIKQARIKLGNKYNFNGLKMFQVTQKMEDNDDYPDNKSVIIGEEHLQKTDYFDEEIKADILIITSKYKNIALSHRMADCPVLIAEDREKEVSAIVHCNLYHLNRGLPRELIKTLIKQFNSAGGFIYGLLKGFIIIYGLLALIAILSPIININNIVEIINKSIITNIMYNNNIIFILFS